jgi:hypothetical protein
MPRAFSIKLDAQFDIVFSAQLPKKIQATQRASPTMYLFERFPPFDVSEGVISGIGEVIKSTAVQMGKVAKNSVRKLQFSLPKSLKKTVLIRIITVTPTPKRECRKLISRPGLSDGIAATTGLTRTSESPAEIEKITVAIANPVKTEFGKIKGEKA